MGTKSELPEDLKPKPALPITKDWAGGFGFAVYSYEGIGIIFPVQDVTKNPETYFRIVAAVIAVTGALYVAFGAYCAIAWEGNISSKPIVTTLAGQY